MPTGRCHPDHGLPYDSRCLRWVYDHGDHARPPCALAARYQKRCWQYIPHFMNKLIEVQSQHGYP